MRFRLLTAAAVLAATAGAGPASATHCQEEVWAEDDQGNQVVGVCVNSADCLFIIGTETSRFCAPQP